MKKKKHGAFGEVLKNCQTCQAEHWSTQNGCEPGCPACVKEKPPTKQVDLVEIIVDGLDAMTNSCGWNKKHEDAKNLANAAPELLGALKDLIDARDKHMGVKAVTLRYVLAKDVISKAEGRTSK